MNGETSNKVVYSRTDVCDTWPPGADTTNPIVWPDTEPRKNRKERRAEKAMRRKRDGKQGELKTK